MDFNIPSGSNQNNNMTNFSLVTTTQAQALRSKIIVIPELVRSINKSLYQNFI